MKSHFRHRLARGSLADHVRPTPVMCDEDEIMALMAQGGKAGGP